MDPLAQDDPSGSIAALAQDGCSVLVPVLDEAEHIEATMEAMRAQDYPGSIEFLLADGGSTDGTQAIVRRLAEQDPRIRLLDNPLRTTPSGLNVALSQARGRWVARMDAHTEYQPSYVRLGIARLQAGDTRWVSGPPVAVGRGSVSRAVSLALRTRLGRGGSRKWASEMEPAGLEYELDAGVFAGVWERSVLLGYGGWDEGWPRNQDSEMAGRFLARGERLVCLPAMASYYTPRDTLAALLKQYFQYGEYREKTAVRHPHTLRRSHLIAPSLVLVLPTALLAPRGLRRMARGLLALYALALAMAGLTVRGAAEKPADAAFVPIVLALMHLGHGAGMLYGAKVWGVPAAALAEVTGLTRPSPTATSDQPVFAPSLRVRA